MPQLTLRKKGHSAKRGRPARLTIQDVVNAANEIGMSSATLTGVAKRLGVSVPALYRYVKNREELVSLAALDAALKRQMPQAGGAHWTDVARGYAFGIFDLLSVEPQLIVEMMNGTLGPDAEVDFIEQFIVTLKPHGFTPAQAIQLHHSVAMLAVGAAVGAAAIGAAYAGGRTRESAMRELLAKCAPAELPEVRGALGAYVEVGPQQWHAAIDDLLAGVALARGEALPKHSAERTKVRLRQVDVRKRS